MQQKGQKFGKNSFIIVNFIYFNKIIVVSIVNSSVIIFSCKNTCEKWVRVIYTVLVFIVRKYRVLLCHNPMVSKTEELAL